VKYAGREFHVWGRDNAVTPCVEPAYPGYLQLRCAPGDRKPDDKPDRDRIGLDGWRSPFQPGEAMDIEFTVLTRENWLAAGPGDWTNFFELHAFPIRGLDKLEPEGSLLGINEWVWPGKPMSRFYRCDPKFGAGGALIGIERQKVAEFAMVKGNRHTFRLQAKPGDDGYVRVSMNKRSLVDYTGPFGYGARLLYPNFRIYRNARKVVSKALLKVIRCEAVA
jgi:hypothetical protein